MPTVLIVEDEPTMREVLCQHLGRSYSCHAVWSAEQGLALLRAGAGVRVAVTDVRLPGMSGEEFLRAARAARPGLPVIVVTGRDTDEAKFMEAGAFGYLLKPFRLEELDALIERALGARKA